MHRIDIVIETAWAGTTSYIPFLDQPDILFMPTTQYLQGLNEVRQVNVIKYKARGVQINHTATKHSVLKLRYLEVGGLVRT